MARIEGGYRINVAGLIVRGDEVLLCERRREVGEWQMPQGGMEEGEEFEETIFRELGEEIGFDDARERCTILGSTEPVRYTFPAGDPREVARNYVGQQQTVVVLELGGGEELELDLNREDPPEFRRAGWFGKEEALERFWAFKRAPFEAALALLERVRGA